jgi:hypothetical protein
LDVDMKRLGVANAEEDEMKLKAMNKSLDVKGS